MKLIPIEFAITTNGSGAATVNAVHAILGRLFCIEYRPGTIATGATVTVTCEGAASKPLLTKANAGTSDSWYYPRDLVHAITDGSALVGTSGGDRELPLLNGTPRVVVASGGATLTGAVTLYYFER